MARAISNSREAILMVDMKFKRRMIVRSQGFSNSAEGTQKLGFTQIIRESQQYLGEKRTVLDRFRPNILFVDDDLIRSQHFISPASTVYLRDNDLNDVDMMPNTLLSTLFLDILADQEETKRKMGDTNIVHQVLCSFASSFFVQTKHIQPSKQSHKLFRLAKVQSLTANKFLNVVFPFFDALLPLLHRVVDVMVDLFLVSSQKRPNEVVIHLSGHLRFGVQQSHGDAHSEKDVDEGRQQQGQERTEQLQGSVGDPVDQILLERLLARLQHQEGEIGRDQAAPDPHHERGGVGEEGYDQQEHPGCDHEGARFHPQLLLDEGEFLAVVQTVEVEQPGHLIHEVLH